MESFKERIEAAALNPQLLETEADTADAVRSVVAAVNSGSLRVAEPDAEADDGWRINGWVQQAINPYFRIAPMERIESGQLAWYDKIPPRTDHAERSLRAVPTARTLRRLRRARRGAHAELHQHRRAVGRGTMVDTWATVGSCAQIGRDVHLSGGVGIGGVLEPRRPSRDHRGRVFCWVSLCRRRGRACGRRGSPRCRPRADGVDPDHRRAAPPR